jgi:RNA polymerase sigma factor (sigma-70 family)
MQDPSEIQLDRDVAQLAAGDRTVLSSVFQRLWPVVHRFCRRFLGNDADAEDAAQRTLEKLFAQVTDYDGSRSVSAWALTIALWECRTLRRQTTRRRVESLQREFESDEPSPEEAAEREQLRGALNAALDLMKEADRNVLTAVVLAEGLEAGPASQTFRKQKQRAMARLREIWRSLYDT